MRLIAVYLLLLATALATQKPFTVVRVKDSGVAYLLLNKWAKPLVDDDSITALGFDKAALVELSSDDIASKYKVLEAAPTLKKGDGSLDDLTRIEILKSDILNGKLLKEMIPLGNYINPSTIPWQGRLIMASGLEWGFAGVNNKPASGTIQIRWVNSTRHPFTTTEPYLGIHNEVEDFPAIIYGQDPRLIALEDPDRFQVYYTNPMGRPLHMGMAEIAINRSTNSIEVVRKYQTIHPTIDAHQSHKNWSPFLHGKEVLLIQSLNPFMVVKTGVRDGDQMLAFRESYSEAIEIHWPYGEMRGGTNAVYLPEHKVYLAFFHSVGHVPGNFMRTYVMGAYTFTPTPPFRLVAMSPFPIMPEALYTGAWDPIKQRQIDYCLFPMSAFVEGEDLYVGAGHQDHLGYVLRFDLQEMLDSLVTLQQ